MSCDECEELIALAARDGRTLEATAEHLAGCGACLEIAREMATVAAALARWPAPGPAEQAIDDACAALLNRAATPSQRVVSRRRSFLTSLPKHPALLVLPGTAAAAAGLAMLPEWAWVAAACWAAISTVLVSLVVMVSQVQPTAWEGDWRS